jgi:hypothetical protein
MGVKTMAKRDAQIRAARRRGLSLSDVGKRFGISKQAVHMILRRDGETMPPDRRWGVTAEALCAGCGKLIRMSAAPPSHPPEAVTFWEHLLLAPVLERRQWWSGHSPPQIGGRGHPARH